MSWNYSGNPASSNLDAVRFLIGDVDTTDQQLANEEINYLLAQAGNNVYKAAANGALSIASKYARLVDKSVGDLSLSYSQRKDAYEAMAARLTKQASSRSAVPYAGGISVSDKEIDKTDADAVQPAFVRGQFDFPGVDDGESGVEQG